METLIISIIYCLVIKPIYACFFAFTVYNQLNALHFYKVAIREKLEFSMQEETFFF